LRIGVESNWWLEGNYTPRLERMTDADLPIPVSQIARWSLRIFATISGDLWAAQYIDTEPPFHHEWINMGPVPVGPVSAKRHDLGSLKSIFTPRQSVDQR
jgi:hypothetical protein